MDKLKRERNFNGDWGYCRYCGNKAYDVDSNYSLCALSCGYIQTYGGIVYQSKNTLNFNWVAYTEGV